MASIFYKTPRLYEIMLKAVHGKNIKKRYQFISQQIGRDSVLDVGCGTAILQKFLDPESDYMGIDLNEKFINYALKKNIHVMKRSVFEFDQYRKKDIIVMCDILHHVFPIHEQLLQRIAKSAKEKIIICEPFNEYEKNSIFGHIKYKICQFFDNDGFNCPKDKKNQKWYSERELRSFFFSQFKNRKSLEIKRIGNDIIAIYKLR